MQGSGCPKEPWALAHHVGTQWSRTLRDMWKPDRAARDEAGLVHQLLVIVVMSALSGALVAGLALPWIGLASKGAENTAEAIQSFPKPLKFEPLNQRTRVLAADGSRFATFYDENRRYVSLDDISTQMQQAIIAIEDARFYAHGALDVQGTLRALVVNQASDATVQGGSSITQQLVKLTLMGNADTEAQARRAAAQSYARKLDELRYAVWVEDELSKDEILERYLNTAYFGDGAYGIESAANHYFSTTAAELTLRQSALLAGLVKNPTSYDPTNNAAAAEGRRNVVIDKMLDLHIITTQQARRASRSPVKLNLRELSNGCVSAQAPFFCEYLQQYLLDSPALGDSPQARRRALFGGGLTIRSTWDPRFQRAADTSVADHVNPTDKAIGGMAMVEPGTGYVRAIAQSRPLGRSSDEGQTFENYVVPEQYGGTSGFQPGSTFKVFVLAAAIRQGFPLDKTIYAPVKMTVNQGSFPTCGGKNYKSNQPYRVSNSTQTGDMTLARGTQNSVNTFFIKLSKRTGLCDPWKLVNRLGIDVPASFRVPSFALGVSDVSPLEMAEAYATFAARGTHCASTPVTEVLDGEGEVVPLDGPQCERVLKPAYADAVNQILRGVLLPGGFGDDFAPVQPAAGKTGTTQSTRAVWFVGYTPDIAAAVFLAGVNDVNEPRSLLGKEVGDVVLTRASGSRTAGPIWGDAISDLESVLPDRDFVPPNPSAVTGQTVEIPSFYGYDPTTAAEELTELGLRPQISYSINSSAPEGTVASTSPSSIGSSGDVVSIYLSNGIDDEPTSTPEPTPETTPTPGPLTYYPPGATPSPSAEPTPGPTSGPPPTFSPTPSPTFTFQPPNPDPRPSTPEDGEGD